MKRRPHGRRFRFGRDLSGILASLLREDIEQRLELASIVAPAPDRTVIERLTDLPRAERPHRSRVPVEFEAGGLPFQTEKSNQPAAFAFEIGDESFILDI